MNIALLLNFIPIYLITKFFLVNLSIFHNLEHRTSGAWETCSIFGLKLLIILVFIVKFVAIMYDRPTVITLFKKKKILNADGDMTI